MEQNKTAVAAYNAIKINLFLFLGYFRARRKAFFKNNVETSKSSNSEDNSYHIVLLAGATPHSKKHRLKSIFK